MARCALIQLRRCGSDHRIETSESNHPLLQITGYLYIDSVKSVRRIEFPRLRAVWAESRVKGLAAIGIDGCVECEVLSMPQLRGSLPYYMILNVESLITSRRQ